MSDEEQKHASLHSLKGKVPKMHGPKAFLEWLEQPRPKFKFKEGPFHSWSEAREGDRLDTLAKIERLKENLCENFDDISKTKQLAVEYKNASLFKEAVAVCETVLSRSPQNLEVMTLRFICLNRMFEQEGTLKENISVIEDACRDVTGGFTEHLLEHLTYTYYEAGYYEKFVSNVNLHFQNRYRPEYLQSLLLLKRFEEAVHYYFLYPGRGQDPEYIPLLVSALEQCGQTQDVGSLKEEKERHDLSRSCLPPEYFKYQARLEPDEQYVLETYHPSDDPAAHQRFVETPIWRCGCPTPEQVEDLFQSALKKIGLTKEQWLAYKRAQRDKKKQEE